MTARKTPGRGREAGSAAPSTAAPTLPAQESAQPGGQAGPVANPGRGGRDARDGALTAREARLARDGRRRIERRPVGNPLREGLRLERVPDPCLFVLFGSTGDLARRKVIPALYQLWRTHLLPQEFALVAFGRRPYGDDAFRAEVRAALERHSRVLPLDEAAWRQFSERIVYQRGDFDDPASFAALSERLDALDHERGTRGNRLFYLATQASAFAEIVGQLGRAGLDHEVASSGWRRIIVEKPFGRDLDSGLRLNREIGKVFRERQVYRIDHYLGKETVRNLLVFRFGNGIFEPIWNRRYVDHVQITVAESIGVEGRGSFYEETGAARDILQNHLLQLLSLVAMEPPTAFSADALRNEKVKVLGAISPMEAPEVERQVVRGQYGPGWVEAAEVPGYRAEPEVDPLSETETFIAARLEIDDWRWAGVPFYLRTGKRLPKRATEIAIQFKAVPHRLFEGAGTDPEPNLLAIRVQPDEGILLRFSSKVPGLGLDIRPVSMDFAYGSSFTADAPEAYETLILDALLGDQSLFTRADEVEEAWGIVTPILETWAEQPAPAFPSYPAGTWGPEAAETLIARDGRRWRRI